MISLCCEKFVKEIMTFELRGALARVILQSMKVYEMIEPFGVLAQMVKRVMK